MKKTIAFILTLVMLLSLCVPAFAAPAQGTEMPNIYLQGQGAAIYNREGVDVYTVDLEDGFLGSAVQECMPSFVEALRNDTPENWDAYRAKFYEVVMPIFGPFFLDKNGEPSDGTHINKNWWNDPAVMLGNGYDFRSYNFFQDWRLDPFANAADLKDYIDKVKAESGKDKVNVVCRCEGANVVLAYLAEYGYEDVNCLELYVQSGSGVDLMNALFSGEMQFDAAALRRFKATSDFFTISDKLIDELLDAALEFTGDTLLLDAGLLGLQALEPKIYKELLSYVIRDTYGTFPGIWSLVGAEYYQTARAGIFGGYEDEYAGLLEKLDDYDVRVRQRVNEILLEAQAAGVKIANFAKYGNYQIQPICKTNNEISDNSVALSVESLGATTAKIGSKLSDSYIENAKKNGTDKYISPDRMVDTSTCLFPETTWIIFGSEHRDFPDCIHDEMFKFLLADGGITVFDDPSFPLYTMVEGNAVVPMTVENATEIDSYKPVFKSINFKEVFLRFWNAIVAFIKRLIGDRFGF